MSGSRELYQLVGKGNQLEDDGQYALAEAAYVEALKQLSDEDPGMQGRMYVTLGNCRDRAGDLDGALAYFDKAIELLDHLRGDDILECAYAHYNCVRLQIARKDYAKAVESAVEALKRFRKYPWTSGVDIADAMAIYMVAKVNARGSLSREELEETWAVVCNVSLSDLNQVYALDFLSIYAGVQMGIHEDLKDYEESRRRIEAWAGKELADRVMRRVDEDASAFRARLEAQWTKQRLIDGLFGSNSTE